jgi:hypothetical protein
MYTYVSSEIPHVLQRQNLPLVSRLRFFLEKKLSSPKDARCRILSVDPYLVILWVAMER